MTNPLLQKYEEIYGKKEKPKPQKTHTEKLKELRDTSTIPITKLTSYDTHSGKDSFLQIAEKIKNEEARVTSVSCIHDSAGIFTTGLTTITFEVQVWDTP